MSIPTIYGSLGDPRLQEQLSHAQAHPQRWTVYLIPENGEKRTLAQNRLYRALLARLAQAHGRSVAYWNEYLVERFLGYDEVMTEDGYARRVLVATSSLSVAEFSSFLSACLAWADENKLS